MNTSLKDTAFNNADKYRIDQYIQFILEILKEHVENQEAHGNFQIKNALKNEDVCRHILYDACIDKNTEAGPVIKQFLAYIRGKQFDDNGEFYE